jgi:hypothetical protein
MDNGELVIIPEAVRCGDMIIILSGAISGCVVRPFPDGSWVLVSGDCHMFTDEFRPFEDSQILLCEEYVAYNQDRAEEFRLR